MARAFSPMAHQAPHHPPARPAPPKSAPASAHHAHKPHPARRHGHGGLITGLLVAAAIASGLVWYAMAPGLNAPDPTEQLLAQMQAAAAGTVVSPHAFGGALTVAHGNGPANVTAEGLPSKACVQVGWRLSKEGTIIVNGVLPQRLSAARLSELCSSDGGATLTWVPEE